MSDTLRAAAQQALEALLIVRNNSSVSMHQLALISPAIDALRAALAEPTGKDSLTVAGDTLPPLPERLRTYSADTELSGRYSDAMQEAADEIERLGAALAASVATEREMAGEIERLVRERDEQREKLIPLLELARKAGQGIGDKK